MNESMTLLKILTQCQLYKPVSIFHSRSAGYSSRPFPSEYHCRVARLSETPPSRLDDYNPRSSRDGEVEAEAGGGVDDLGWYGNVL